jgi:hypothetical protein
LRQVWVKAEAKKVFGRIGHKPASQQAIHSSNEYKNQDTKKKNSLREWFWFWFCVYPSFLLRSGF